MVDNAEFRHRIPEEDAGHTCIPNAVLLDPRIAPMTRLCYSVIKSYAYGNKRDARPGQKTLAEQLGVKDRMVRYYLSELEVLGLISIEQRGLGLTNVYWIEPLAGLSERIPKYLEWLKGKKGKRQPVATQDRQPIASQERKSVADPGGSPLPTKNTSKSKKKTREEKKDSPLPLSRQALANTDQTADTTASVVLGNGQTPSLEVSPPAAPKGYVWLCSSDSLAAMHLIQDKGNQTNYNQQHALCDTPVQHRSKFTPGLECVNRPCPECQRIAAETNLLLFALAHVTGADPNLNRDVKELARDLQKAGYVAEDVATYEAIWRKGWQWTKNPGQKPGLEWVRLHIGEVKSDVGESKYSASQELRMRLRELRAGEPIADRRIHYANEIDDHPALAAGTAPLVEAVTA